jgi:hypothetical protein
MHATKQEKQKKIKQNSIPPCSHSDLLYLLQAWSVRMRQKRKSPQANFFISPTEKEIELNEDTKE